MSGELLAFILYFVVLLAIGAFFFSKSKSDTESDYFLGGRSMGKWVTALSAQASDMSGWLLMGLPGSILAAGLGEMWIAIGLALGSYLSWLLIAGRLRNFSETAGDSITIPQYLNNRFKASGLALQIISAVVFFVCFTVYVASGFKAGATLFSQVMNFSENSPWPMIIFGSIIIIYTFTGGFKAVCWTDFFQALLMLVAMVLVPIFAINIYKLDVGSLFQVSDEFGLFAKDNTAYQHFTKVVSGFAWGLGYFGMPHIIIRYMSIQNSKMVKSSRRIATSWVIITLAMTVVIGVVGRNVFPNMVTDGTSEQVFIRLVRTMFPAFISGVLLSAILAASMSTADSQLLVASSAFTSDIYKPIFRKNASSKEILWVGRLVVIAISVIAFFVARNPNAGSIMSLVSNAWAGFGAAFGPVIILSLYWKRFTYKGAIAGIICGGLTVVLWIRFMSFTGIYELLPGFIAGLLACVIGTLFDKAPSKDIDEMFKKAVEMSK